MGGWVSEGVSRVREGVGGRGNTCMYWTCLHCALCYIHFCRSFSFTEDTQVVLSERADGLYAYVRCAPEQLWFQR